MAAVGNEMSKVVVEVLERMREEIEAAIETIEILNEGTSYHLRSFLKSMVTDEYGLILSKKFDREFAKLEKNMKDRTVLKLKTLVKNPMEGKALKGKLKGLWSLRIGKYRLIYRVNEASRVVEVITIEHREVVYE